MVDMIKVADLQREIIQLKKDVKGANTRLHETEQLIEKLREEKQEWKSMAHILLLKLELDK
jgi:septal ring factor EnvC (AmiA/AmiB activator)